MRLLAAVGIAAVLAAAPASADSKRIAIVVGNNAGSGEMPPLRYAESDAGKFARVLAELGDVQADDVMLLQGRRVADLERAISDAKDRVSAYKKSPDLRTVLMFYFSGHSDGESIEVGREKLAYARLKAMLSGTGADVRVAIIDACKSGAGFREKGGKPAEGFVIKLTDTLVATGEAFITSSAADESALESSEVMGSFFTHNFISGLRGAADASGDKLVTLAEAYRYAYDRTVSATAVLAAGAQHPSYDYRLSGQGELVLASLLRPSATLTLPEGAERSLVTDVARDQVVVELTGQTNARELALAPGQYALRVIRGGQTFGGRFSLIDGSKRSVSWAELTPMSSSMSVAAKGGGSTVSGEVTAPPPPPRESDPKVLSFAGGVTRTVADAPRTNEGDVAGPMTAPVIRIGFEPWRSSGPVFAALGTFAVATGVSELTGGVRAGYRFSFQWWRMWFGIGAEAGVNLTYQAFTGNQVDELTSVSFALAGRAGVRLNVAGPVWLTLDGEMGVMVVRLNQTLAALPMPQGSLGLAFDL